MKSFASLLIACLLMASPSSAQEPCCTLSITTEVNPVRPVQTISLQVDGTLPDALVYLVSGPNLGETTINLRRLGALVLDLDRPFNTMLIGTSDSNGDLSKAYTIPSDLGLTLNAQAVGFRIGPNPGGKTMARFCKSNVVTVDL